MSVTTTTAIAVGLLGGYTTFSTFGYETFTWCGRTEPAVAICWAVLSLLGGLAATALGYATGRAVA